MQRFSSFRFERQTFAVKPTNARVNSHPRVEIQIRIADGAPDTDTDTGICKKAIPRRKASRKASRMHANCSQGVENILGI